MLTSFYIDFINLVSTAKDKANEVCACVRRCVCVCARACVRVRARERERMRVCGLWAIYTLLLTSQSAKNIRNTPSKTKDFILNTL